MEKEYGWIIYDGLCGLCNRIIRLVLKWDREGYYRFVPYQKIDLIDLPRCLNKFNPEISIILIEGEGCFQKSHAVFRIQRRLSRYNLLFGLLRLLPRGWTDALYDFIARYRYPFFGKYPSCPAPDPKFADRFVGGKME